MSGVKYNRGTLLDPDSPKALCYPMSEAPLDGTPIRVFAKDCFGEYPLPFKVKYQNGHWVNVEFPATRIKLTLTKWRKA